VSDNAPGHRRDVRRCDPARVPWYSPAWTRSATPPRRSPRGSPIADRGAGRDPRCSARSGKPCRRSSARPRARFSLSVDRPNVLIGVMIGAAVVFLLLSGLAIMAVGRAAGRVVYEVREQFRTHPGIMDFTEKPEYGPGWSTSAPRTRWRGAGHAWPAGRADGRSRSASRLATLRSGAFLAGAIAAGAADGCLSWPTRAAPGTTPKKLVEDGNYGREGLGGARGHHHRRHGWATRSRTRRAPAINTR